MSSANASKFAEKSQQVTKIQVKRKKERELKIFYIMVALSQTDRIMKEIDKIEIE